MSKKKNLIVSEILIVCSIIYTILVKLVDVKSIGPEGSSVGFSKLNSFISKLIGVNMNWYKITKYLGYLAICVILVYALIGFIELIKRKSIIKVDREIIGLGVFCFVVLCIYIFFEKCVINYRPILMEGVLDASYPSSHTMLALCFCGAAIMVNNKLYNDFKYKKIINILLLTLMFIIVVGRVISGVHWISAIIGAIIISSALLMSFKTYLYYKD